MVMFGGTQWEPVSADNPEPRPLVGVEDENRRPPGGSKLHLTSASHTPSHYTCF